ncbi:MAG: dihydroorotate dehydrogenase-like protein [Bacteroidales bacterium]|nr:dihydroorotate dehydrogenase-like protein [Bacteroidales bacterium]
MADLKTTYVGLKLRNPFIVSSSGLTNSIQNIEEIEQAGAGAVVLKSLFEEQIRNEAGQLTDFNDYHTEAYDYINTYVKDNSVDNYLNLIKQAKLAVDIPIIASINCISGKDWTSYAKQIETAGADALELNIYTMALDKSTEGAKYEAMYFEIVKNVQKAVKIPVVVKLGYYFTNLVYVVNRLSAMKVAGVVLFNRFFSPDIDINDFSIKPASIFTSPDDLRIPLRWMAIINSKVKQIDLSASTGIHDTEAVFKMLLVGADTVQVCSVLYQKGIPYLSEMIKGLEQWMTSKNYSSISDFRGKMSYLNIEDPALFERAQFMKHFSSFE